MQVTFSAETVPQLVQQMVAFLANVTEVADLPDTQAATPIPPTAPVTLEEVRAKFSALIRAGRSDRAKEILRELGAANLSGLAPDLYARALAMAESA